jgi:hypothetical protein
MLFNHLCGSKNFIFFQTEYNNIYYYTDFSIRSVKTLQFVAQYKTFVS